MDHHQSLAGRIRDQHATLAELLEGEEKVRETQGRIVGERSGKAGGGQSGKAGGERSGKPGGERSGKAGGGWKKALIERAVQLDRLLVGLADLNRKAGEVCQGVARAVRSKD